MKVRDAYNYLTEAIAVSKLESFMAFGGEPMLYSNRAIAIFKKANEFRIPKIEMITNGTWGKERETAERLARKLKTAGVNTLAISVDAFHQQHIPIEYPRNAALASLEAGIRHVHWNVTVIESINATNEYDVKTSHILETLKRIGLEVHVHRVSPVDRAAENLRQYLQFTSLEGPCEGDPVLGDTLTDPRSICIEPSGEVDVCWHLSIGNARETPLSHIISQYDWRKNPTINTLVKEGPTGLLKRHEPQASQLKKNDYINKCHLCTEIRKTRNLA
jgi:MoaA/NifB/PqqE/SkfB family radical SAM enzyme